MGQPCISAIIPAYNGESFLADAIDSIYRQNYHPLEIIVVDDGSTDDTAVIAQSYGDDLRYVYQSRRGGPAAGRNRGVKMAHGEVIGFLDQDDLWVENRIEDQLPHMVANPTVDIVLGLAQIMRLVGFDERKPIFQEFADPWNFPLVGSALYRKTVFDKVGLFDESFTMGDDVDWFLRAKELGISMITTGRVSLQYRLHSNNTASDIASRQSDFMKALKKSLNRRRQGNRRSAARLNRWFDTDSGAIQRVDGTSDRPLKKRQGG